MHSIDDVFGEGELVEFHVGALGDRTGAQQFDIHAAGTWTRKVVPLSTQLSGHGWE